jgi:hypothetical protein
MNAKHIVAALSIALAGSAAMATEATQFVVADQPAAAAPAQAPTAIVVSNNEATQFADVSSGSRDRAEVRAEARAANRDNAFNALYVGA